MQYKRQLNLRDLDHISPQTNKKSTENRLDMKLENREQEEIAKINKQLEKLRKYNRR